MFSLFCVCDCLEIDLVVQPWETYESNLSIDLSKHHVPKTFIDKVAYRTVKLLRIPTDIFFKVNSLVWLIFFCCR